MIQMRYIGDVAVLKGKTALVMHAAEAVVRAQFDEKELTVGMMRMDLGWHEFPRTDFEEVKE